MCDISIFSLHIICQLPLSNFQDLGKSYFPFLDACFLNSLSTCSPKPRCELVRSLLCSSALHSSPIMLRTCCCSVDLDGDLTDSVLLSVFHPVPQTDFLNSSFRIHCYITHLLLFLPFPTEYCPNSPQQHTYFCIVFLPLFWSSLNFPNQPLISVKS